MSYIVCDNKTISHDHPWKRHASFSANWSTTGKACKGDSLEVETFNKYVKINFLKKMCCLNTLVFMSLLVMLNVIRKHRVFIKINNFPDFTCYKHSKFVMHSSLMQAHVDDKLYNKLKEYKKLHLLNNLHKSCTQVSVKAKGSLRTEL